MTNPFKISLSLMAFIILLSLGLHGAHGCRERKQERQTSKQTASVETQSQELVNQIKHYEYQIDSIRYRRDSTITELFFLSDSGIQNRLDSLFNSGHVLPQ